MDRAASAQLLDGCFSLTSVVALGLVVVTHHDGLYLRPGTDTRVSDLTEAEGAPRQEEASSLMTLSSLEIKM